MLPILFIICVQCISGYILACYLLLAIVQFIHGGQRLYTLLPARNRLPTSLAAAMQLPKDPRSISMTKSYDSNLMKRLRGL